MEKKSKPMQPWSSLNQLIEPDWRRTTSLRTLFRSVDISDHKSRQADLENRSAAMICWLIDTLRRHYCCRQPDELNHNETISIVLNVWTVNNLRYCVDDIKMLQTKWKPLSWGGTCFKAYIVCSEQSTELSRSMGIHVVFSSKFGVKLVAIIWAE